MNLAGFLPILGTAALAGCAAILGYIALTPATLAPAEAQRAVADPGLQTAQEQTRSVTLPVARPDIYYAAIMERPLFAPTRRPMDQTPEPNDVVEITPAAIAPIVSQPHDLVLSGILEGANSRSAYVGKSNGQSEWLRMDDNIDGWTIAEIGPDWITLTAGEDTFRLELFE